MNARSAGSDAGSAEAPAVSYVVPTVGVPEHVARCLESIYRDAAATGAAAELIVVWQRPAATSRDLAHETGKLVGSGTADQVDRSAPTGGPAALRELARQFASDHPNAFERSPLIVQLSRPAGFARAANAGIAVSRGHLIALVNDDAVLATGWTRTLLAALGACDGAAPKMSADSPPAAAQGLNLLPAGTGKDEARIDGAGLAWNRRWQAIPVDRGKLAPPAGGAPAGGAPAGGAPRPIYGVSATAAIYRREALVAVSPAGGPLRPFNERLESYYEDVELADRLRRASYESVLAPAARIEHAGAMSSRGRRAARRRVRRIYCNRLLVLAKRLGRRFWLLLPGLLLRDAVDLVRGGRSEALPGDAPRPRAVDLLFAWGRAVRLLPWFAGFGRGQVARSPEPARRPAHPAPEERADWVRRRPRRLSEEDARGQRPRSAATPVHSVPEGVMGGAPVLTAVAPHWHDEENLALLVRSWPRDGRFELIVVDNGSSVGPGIRALQSAGGDAGAPSARAGGDAGAPSARAGEDAGAPSAGVGGEVGAPGAGRANVHIVEPGRNLGFAAAVNRGAANAGGGLLLILNTDARPESGALESLIRGMAQHPEAAGLAPRLLDEDGAPQAGWQLRRLPGLRTLLGYCCFVEPGPMPEPPAGSPVEQPAACALLLRRDVFEAVEGMDEGFWPAWFEDVDLARRLREQGDQVLYWPDATFRHGLGASVPRLGYGPFLLAYYRNLDRYARKHHGRGATLLLRAVLTVASLLRIVVLPLRRPRRACGRGEAAVGLWRLAAGAATGWRGR